MTKKSFLTLVSAIFLVLILAACGNDKNKDESENTDTGDTDTATVPDTDPTDTGDTEVTPDEEPAEVEDSEIVPDEDNTDPETVDPEWAAKYKKADESAEKVSEDVVKANNKLGLEIFSRLAQEEGAKNMMISPLSIAISMAMTANGATGDALAEMKEVLGFGEMELPDVNEQFAQLIASLVEADKDMVLEIANSVWMDDAFAPDVKQDFIDVLTEYYDAALFAENFKDAATVEKINSWVSEKTHGKIDKILEKIGPDTVMHLINAIYFKAAWTTAFDKDRTYKGRFTLSDESEVTADYMDFNPDADFQLLSYSYDSWENGFSVIRIPYGRDVFAFYGIVPSYGNETNIDDFIVQIAENGFDHYLQLLSKKTLKNFPLKLPKFKFGYEKSLVNVFKELGMEMVFVGGLDNISGSDLYISDIFHKTFIEVNEEGTEAAAITDVGVDCTGDLPGFYADRPFVFMIRDDRTGSILFIGKVEDPTKE